MRHKVAQVETMADFTRQLGEEWNNKYGKEYLKSTLVQERGMDRLQTEVEVLLSFHQEFAEMHPIDSTWIQL